MIDSLPSHDIHHLLSYVEPVLINIFHEELTIGSQIATMVALKVIYFLSLKFVPLSSVTMPPGGSNNRHDRG
jgi:hypothetical protein